MGMSLSSATPTRVEVVTSVQRRSFWSPEQKLEIFKLTNPAAPFQWLHGNLPSVLYNFFNGVRNILKVLKYAKAGVM